ncbi:probable G-protein coupled receptor 21 isoform X3 [Cynoglossus semilaevis]|uniref:probable G-protein coupled receptor 21 isoform X3 n=1 Tax=Cynoglossus semilaevis TaxID=244447 RepID=UPI0007DC9E80|nr:probable G-protein coupled receptor 21 isoform X3 [Cynoglossus semilaevis]
MFESVNLSRSDDLNLSGVELTHRSIKVSIIITLGVIITLGNIAVLLVITSSVAGWSRSSRYFLLSLTAADSAFGLLVMPLNLSVSLLKDYSEGPDLLCHIVAFCNATIYSTCMYTLATISLERYIAVFYPLQYSSLMTRKRTLLLIAFSWCFPPCLLAPITFPDGIIEVHFSNASLVCNPSYSTNVGYSISLTCFIFFPCSGIMTFANLRVWCAAKRQRLKLRKYYCERRSRHNVASRVLVPVMAAYYTCWTPCMAAMIYNVDLSGRLQIQIHQPPGSTEVHWACSLGSDRIRVDRVCHCMATRLQWLPELYLLFLDQPELPEKISPGPPEVDCVLVS